MLKIDPDLFREPSYIVLNVPSPAADEIRNIRTFFDPSRANLAVEISLCGSNGLGTIFPGQDPELVFAETDAIAQETEPFRAQFGAVRRFPDTGIFYYTLQDPEPFLKLHALLAQSKIKFNPVTFPYEPHCTLKLSLHAEYTEKQLIGQLRPPQQGFDIDTMSVYSLSREQKIPRLLHRVNLGNNQP
ncbi:MAG: 2'-5' RNA ligase family protein [Victivallales bacterium]|nr:2'-5' RNA ligase family protein [Victivallales bacterium]